MISAMCELKCLMRLILLAFGLNELQRMYCQVNFWLSVNVRGKSTNSIVFRCLLNVRSKDVAISSTI